MRQHSIHVLTILLYAFLTLHRQRRPRLSRPDVVKLLSRVVRQRETVFPIQFRRRRRPRVQPIRDLHPRQFDPVVVLEKFLRAVIVSNDFPARARRRPKIPREALLARRVRETVIVHRERATERSRALGTARHTREKSPSNAVPSTERAGDASAIVSNA